MNKTIALRAKKIRQFIIAHPGCTKDEIYAAHSGENVGGGFALLQKHGMIKFEKASKKTPAKWYAKEAIINNYSTVRNGDNV